MTNALQTLAVLIGIAVLVLGFIASAYAVTYLVVLLVLRRVPLVGRRHRSGPLIGREPIETASSKLGRR